MTKVIIESPFSGDIELNKAYASACMKDCFYRGEIPFASHLLYTQVLDDSDPVQRDKGITAGLEFGKLCDKTVVYIDLGISHGMQLGILSANENNRPVELRRIESFDAKKFKRSYVSIDTLFDDVCRITGFTGNELKSKSRDRDLVYARHSWSYIAHKVFGVSSSEIGKFISRDHATVLRYYNEVKNVKEKSEACSKIWTKLNL